MHLLPISQEWQRIGRIQYFNNTGSEPLQSENVLRISNAHHSPDSFGFNVTLEIE